MGLCTAVLVVTLVFGLVVFCFGCFCVVWINLFLFGCRVVFFGVFVLVFCRICVVGLGVNRFGTDSCRRQVRVKRRKINSRWGFWWVQW